MSIKERIERSRRHPTWESLVLILILNSDDQIYEKGLRRHRKGRVDILKLNTDITSPLFWSRKAEWSFGSLRFA